MCFSIISGSMATAAKTEVLLLLLYRILYSMYNNDRRASRRSSWWRLHYGEPWGCTASRTTRSASPPSPTGTVLLFVLFLALSRWGRLRPADKFQSQLQEKEPLKLGLPLWELKTSFKHNIKLSCGSLVSEGRGACRVRAAWSAPPEGEAAAAFIIL